MKNKIKSKVIRPHSEGCRIKRWSGVLKQEPFFGNWNANPLAKIGNYHLWYIVLCNDPSCEGEKAVHSSVLANA